MRRGIHCFLGVAVAALVGCSTILSQRPPIIEDKVGTFLGFDPHLGTLASAPDYRISYVKLKKDTTFCAEAPADAAAQFASKFAGGLDVAQGGTTVGVNAQLGLALAMKQLFKRSQGLQFYRDGSFVLCNMYLNGALKEDAYIKELAELRVAAKEMILAEVKYMANATIDVINVPDASLPPKQTTDPKTATTTTTGTGSGS